jgi:hypothetical protein
VSTKSGEPHDRAFDTGAEVRALAVRLEFAAPDVHGDDVARYRPSSLRRSVELAALAHDAEGSPSADGVTRKTAQGSLTEQSGESGQDGTIGREYLGCATCRRGMASW